MQVMGLFRYDSMLFVSQPARMFRRRRRCGGVTAAAGSGAEGGPSRKMPSPSRPWGVRRSAPTYTKVAIFSHLDLVNKDARLVNNGSIATPDTCEQVEALSLPRCRECVKIAAPLERTAPRLTT